MLVPEEQLRLEEIGDQLRAKITSKFTACSFLAGIAVTVLSIQLSILWDSERLPRLLSVSIGGTVTAILLFGFALLAFDALTMPKRFWPQRDVPHWAASGHFGYLTPDDLDQLHAQMMYWWVQYALVATGLLVLAALLLLVPVTATNTNRIVEESLCGALVGGGLAGGYVVMMRILARRRFPGLMRPFD